MTLIDRLKKYIKHRFSMQEFSDYKTTEGQIVTGELNIGKELMDLESMTPLDGEIIVDNKKIVVEKGVVKSIEDLPEMEVETPEEVVLEEITDEVTGEVCGDCEDGDCSCDDSIDDTIDTTITEMAPMDDMKDMKDMMMETIDSMKSEIESLKSEIESLKSEKMDMTSKIQELSNKPVQEVFKAVEPIKMKTNSKDSLLSSLKELSKSIG
jgi:predicted  nucleic acid-binding Zn-ribbon protein